MSTRRAARARTHGVPYDQLEPAARERARAWYREASTWDEWWQYVYDDAERVGVRITAFDVEGRAQARGNIPDAYATARAIVEQHGDACETTQAARRFLVHWRLLDAQDEEQQEEVVDRWRLEVLELYANILQKEYEFQQADETVEENIRANEYRFDAQGRCV